MIVYDIEIKSKKWVAEKNIEHFIELVLNKIIAQTLLKKYLKKTNLLQINISLLSDQQIKKINQKYRKKNKATNVLSFANLDENSDIIEEAKNGDKTAIKMLIQEYQTQNKIDIQNKKNEVAND